MLIVERGSGRGDVRIQYGKNKFAYDTNNKYAAKIAYGLAHTKISDGHYTDSAGIAVRYAIYIETGL